MKIKKLEPPFDTVKLANKINEIIEVLNVSVDSRTANILDNVSDISCDRLTPLPNETTATETLPSFTSEQLVNMMSDSLSLQPDIWADKKCPHCGASYYTPESSYTTALYCPPIYKDGVNINKMKNESKTTYRCFSCYRCWEETD